MGWADWLPKESPCKQFGTHEQLYQGLQRLDSRAIVCLQSKALSSVRKLGKQYHLPAQAAEEVLNQATMLFLQKIESGAYTFQGHAPSTYLIEVAKRMVYAKSRQKKPLAEPIEEALQVAAEDYEALARQRSAAELISRFLGQLGERCAQVIRLHHIEGYRDDEVVAQAMTPYSTVNSLKMKRSDCMKKLIKIAQAWRTSINT